MIGIVDVQVQAHNPEMPLFPLKAYSGSPSSIRVRNVPKQIGSWKITSVVFTAVYPDGQTKSAQCVPVNNIWVGTIAGSDATGTTENGYTIFASGIDESGNQVNDYVLGKGDIEILDSTGVPTPSSHSYFVHLLSAESEDPKEGDLFPTLSGYMIWQDGAARPLTDIDPSRFIEYPELQPEYSEWVLSIAPTSGEVDAEQKVVMGSYEESIPGEYHTYIKLGRSPDIHVTNYMNDGIPRLEVGRQTVPLFKDLPSKTSQLSNDSGYPTYQNPGHFIKYDAYPSSPNRWIINFGRSSTGGITLVSDEDNPISSYINIAGRIITAGGGSQTRSGAGLQSVSPSEFIAVNDRPLAFADQLSGYAQKSETSSAAELSSAFETVSASLGNVYTKNETSSAAELSTALADFALTSQIPTSVSQLDNDSGYVDGEAVQGMLDSYYQKSETSSASELQTAFSNITVEVDPQLRTDIDSKVLVNEVSAQSLKINVMALSDYAEISGTAAFDPEAFYCISDDTAGGGGDMSNYYTKNETSSAAELSTAFSAAAGYDLGKTYVKYADGSTVAYNLTGWVNGNLSTVVANPLDIVEVRIGSNVTAFGNDGFRKWTSLTAVYYPDSVASIGDRAFLGDNKLAHVELPDQLTSLGSYMFEDCSALTSLTIPRGIVQTSEGTFNRAAGLKEMQFSDGLQQVGPTTFTNCVNLKKVVFPASLTSIAGHLYGTRVFDGTSNLSAVFLGKTYDEITAMANYSQWGGTNLVVSGWIPASQEWVEGQIPTNISELNNDSGYLDESAVQGMLENYYTQSETSSATEIAEAFGDVNTILEALN